jgi:cellulose synthase operon protein YhjQ
MATLYSRASAEATRYWDFSASRKQVRGKFLAGTGRETVREFQAPGAEPPQRVMETVPEPAPKLPRQAKTPMIAPEQGTATRWYALRSVFAPAQPLELPPISQRQSPVFAFFSCAGGVGKTCLVATLGRALAALGEQLLLTDTASCGMLPFYFGSRESRPGAVRTFFPPGPALGAEADAPIRVVNLQPARYFQAEPEHDPWLSELISGGRWVNRILVDVSTANQEVTGRLQRLKPTVVVPVLPDMSSVASVGMLEALPESGELLYLLNQFDADSPLHLDVRAILQQQLGDRLLPFTVRRSYAVSEALAEGMTVIDYAPDSAVAEDYRVLASWLRSLAAPATVGVGGVRWMER